ncbi:hypothetical protein GQ44DRAFT_714894 [Phaeosphaeriaceae sp. PMI808]|nr:hypothetical protein GQ44DRAFT_714894 [Phaeosphaeriaceae sp. PMI808]
MKITFILTALLTTALAVPAALPDSNVESVDPVLEVSAAKCLKYGADCIKSRLKCCNDSCFMDKGKGTYTCQ